MVGEGPLGPLGVAASVLTELQGTINGYMSETVTNARTGVTTPCYIAFDKSPISRLEGVVFWEHVPKWRLKLPLAWNGVAVDTQLGDRLVHPTRGAYALIEVESPDTYAIAIPCWGALLHPTAGTIIVPNVTVQFIRTGQPAITVPVYMRDISQDLLLKGEIAEYDWSVAFDPLKAVYADGSTVGANDKIAWSQLGMTSGSTPRTAAISKPRPQFGPITYSVALFKELP